MHPLTNPPLQITALYTRIAQVFQQPTVPSFFTWFGHFPEYLEHITTQLEQAAGSQCWRTLAHMQQPYTELVTEALDPHLPTQDWLRSQTQHTPQNQPHTPNDTYHSPNPNTPHATPAHRIQMRHDLHRITATNLMLAFVFIQIRTQVRTWRDASMHQQRVANTTDTALATMPHQLLNTEEFALLSGSGLLRAYLARTKEPFTDLMKSDMYLFTRVQLEELMQKKLRSVPDFLDTPFNTIMPMIQKHPRYGEFLYLLHDSFPVAAMQRFLFSAWVEGMVGER